MLAFEALFALSVGAVTGFVYTIPLWSYLIVSACFSVLLAYGAAVAKIWRPVNWQWVGRVCLCFTLVAAQMALLSWTKVMMPHAVGFWADPYLASVDHALFGRDPWTFSHALVGWADPIFDRAYVTWAPLKFAALFYLILMPANERRNRLFLAYFLILASGAIGQYLLPSAGPIFYERLGLGDRFEMPLLPWAETAANYLWADYLNPGERIGTGISAFPSMHVAIAVWMALFLRSEAPRLAPLGYVYATLIMIGSVHLGWHYAVDGLAGGTLAVLAYRVKGARVIQVRVFRRNPIRRQHRGA